MGMVHVCPYSTVVAGIVLEDKGPVSSLTRNNHSFGSLLCSFLSGSGAQPQVNCMPTLRSLYFPCQ